MTFSITYWPCGTAVSWIAMWALGYIQLAHWEQNCSFGQFLSGCAKAKAAIWYCVHTIFKHWPCLLFPSNAFPHIQLTNHNPLLSLWQILRICCWFVGFLEFFWKGDSPYSYQILENRQILVASSQIPADKTMEQGNKRLFNSGFSCKMLSQAYLTGVLWLSTGLMCLCSQYHEGPRTTGTPAPGPVIKGSPCSSGGVGASFHSSFKYLL